HPHDLDQSELRLVEREVRDRRALNLAFGKPGVDQLSVPHFARLDRVARELRAFQVQLVDLRDLHGVVFELKIRTARRSELGEIGRVSGAILVRELTESAGGSVATPMVVFVPAGPAPRAAAKKP